MLKKFFVINSFFLIIVISKTCYSFDFSIEKGIWPVYFQDNATLSILSPFIQRKKKSSEHRFTFRPFFLYNSKNNGDYRFYMLYPLVEFSKQGALVTKRIFPLFSKKYNAKKTAEENFTSLFPVFWGKTSDNVTYGGIFPFYGKLIKKFHYNKIEFFLWPLYYTKEKKNIKDYHFIWPFFGFGTGKNYSALRFWPFFGFKNRKNIFERKFFLWPFFIFQKKKIGNYPLNFKYTNIYFPFYIHTFTNNNDYDYKTILFPFFRYNKRGSNYRYYGFPWPFFTFEKNGNFFDLSVFPFIHRVYKERFEKFSFLWVIFRNEKLFSKNRKNKLFEKTSFLLLNRFEKNFQKNTAYSNIWPFYEYWREGDNYIFKLFEPLPLRIPGVYELYSVFFNIFYIVKQENLKKISFLWGLLSYTSNPTEKCLTVLKIFKFRWDNKPVKDFDKLSWHISYEIGT
jgi:hypothetical protein